MGTREVYEEKLRTGNLYHDPTINPGLGSPRCPRCLSLIKPPSSGEASCYIVPSLPVLRLIFRRLQLFQMRHLKNLWQFVPQLGEAEWTITSVLHDAAAVAGSGAGAMLSAVHGFNTGIPFVQKHVKGPKWMQFLIGVPPLLLFSGTSAVFGAYALPKFAQLSVTSYYTAWTSSHYTISQITRYVERAHSSDCIHEKT